MSEIQTLIESLSPNERKIIPYLNEGSLEKIDEKSNIGKTSVLRALEFLSNKKIIEITMNAKKTIELGINGLRYLKEGLPERILSNLVNDNTTITIPDAMDKVELNDNEFKAALGALKKKALINLVNGTIILIGTKENLVAESLEEKLLKTLPKDLSELAPEEKFAFEKLKSRKNIIDIQDKKIINFTITALGNELMNQDLTASKDMIETLTPEIIKTGSWKGKKFRRYDITSPVPRINGGKKHFVNQGTDYAKKIWLEMGFKEMTGPIVTNGFWNFDALFTAQDHPARELHDTFFINKQSKLPNKQLIEKVKAAHEGKIKNSKGWQYKWEESPAKQVLLRTHTTCLSAKTLSKLKKQDLPAKFFAVGKCFRNDTVDWSHGFEFNQTEGIVIDENANLRQLLGYLKEFAKKMGYKKVRFRPHYFPYTEPSLEGDVWNEEKGEWMEVFAAGIFRPEVTEPLLGRPIPVLAWGPGLDRMIMQLYKLKDLRKLYQNDLNMLREMHFWEK